MIFLDMPILVLVSIVSGLLIALSFPFIEFYLRLWLQARNDYRTARGTSHLKLLKICLRNLQSRIRLTSSDLEKTRKYKEQLPNDRDIELETAATTYLVNLEFKNIPGIGPVLRERIMRSCFNGRLASLRNASQVYGIGEQRAYAITIWVNQAERKLPQILNGSFPGKEETNRKYDRLEKEASQEIIDTEDHLSEMQKLEKNCVAGLANLKKVHVSTFVKSYKGDFEASGLVADYLIGCFPEWGKIPDWFKSVLENYGHV